MVHAERLVTAIDRGTTNNRWRDFADEYMLSGRHDVDAAELRGSLERVAQYRAVDLVPLASTLDGWAEIAQSRWAIWMRKQDLPCVVPTRLDEVVTAVLSFADPVLTGAITGGTWDPADRTWRQ